MKNSVCFAFFLANVLPISLVAQHLSLSLRSSLNKTIKISDNLNVGLRNRIQLSPEFNTYTKNYNELFNELDLLPPIDTEDDEEEYDEGSGEEASKKNNKPPDELNTAPFEVDLNLRNATSIRVQYKLWKRWSIEGGYTYYWSPNRVSQGLNSRVSYSPNIKNKKWRFRQALYAQHVVRSSKGKARWDHGFGTTASAQYRFSKAYRMTMQSTLQTELNDGALIFDRTRVDIGLQYKFNDTFRFELRYRFQYRFNRRRNPFSNGLLFSYNIFL